MNKKAVIILSGGMDSTTLLYKLIKDGFEVFAVSFDYGQRHKIELQKASETCAKLHIDHRIVDLKSITGLISNSALTGDIDVPEGHYEAENMKLTVVPNRNMIMASIAIGYAVNIEADTLALGVHVGDHAIYPDCREEFIEKLNAVSMVANYRPVTIYAPFLSVDKGDIAMIGGRMDVDYSMTHTCYKGEEIPCGKCGACQERAEAFAKANLVDPLIK